MHPDIDKLIKLALADGEVTENERTIILRKADSLGLDRDEIEMILEGEIALHTKHLSDSTTEAKDKSKKEGDIKKCPACGTNATSFATKCIDCGHEFRNIQTAKSVNTLVAELEKAEFNARNSKSFGGLVVGLMAIVDGETAMERRIFEAKASVISTFPIPNTKEDILELLSLSLSNVNSIQIGVMIKLAGTGGTYGYKIKYKNAWLGMANKVILKARFSMKDDKSTLNEIEIYAKQLGIK